MADPATELQTWHIIATAVGGAFGAWVVLWPKWKGRMAEERAKGAQEQRDHDAIHDKLRAGEQRFGTVDDRLMDVETGIRQLHKDHGDVQDRLGRIENHIAARNGSEKRMTEMLGKILEALQNK